MSIDRLDTKINCLEEKINLRFEAAERAINKAEAAAEKRFDNVNEFRRTLSDQTAQFVTRTEYNVQHRALNDKVDLLIGTRTSGVNMAWGYLVGFIGILAGVAAVVHYING